MRVIVTIRIRPRSAFHQEGRTLEITGAHKTLKITGMLIARPVDRLVGRRVGFKFGALFEMFVKKL